MGAANEMMAHLNGRGNMMGMGGGMGGAMGGSNMHGMSGNNSMNNMMGNLPPASLGMSMCNTSAPPAFPAMPEIDMMAQMLERMNQENMGANQQGVSCSFRKEFDLVFA